VKVSFLQSGGFAGVTKGCDLDCAALEPGAATELERLVRESGLTSSGTSLSAGARDLKRYEIVIEGGEPGSDPVRVTLDDATIPERARDFVAYLKQRARPRPSA
jgi:hypothetical protein